MNETEQKHLELALAGLCDATTSELNAGDIQTGIDRISGEAYVLIRGENYITVRDLIALAKTSQL